MRIICMSDAHFRSGTPGIRTDDFFETQMRKLDEVVEICNEYDAYLFLGGDFLDSVRVGYRLLNSIIEKLSQINREIIAVVGNHELAAGNGDLTPSPLKTLDLLPNFRLLDGQISFGNVCISGGGWEIEPPEPSPGYEVNILLQHISVFEKAVPFWMEDRAYTPKTLRKKYPGFDWYITGDIHENFVKDDVINSGPILRDNIKHIDYKPRVYLLDTEDETVEPIYINVERDVFIASHIPDIDNPDYSAHINGLINSLKMTAEVPKYDQVCLDLAKEDDKVKTKLEEIFHEYR